MWRKIVIVPQPALACATQTENQYERWRAIKKPPEGGFDCVRRRSVEQRLLGRCVFRHFCVDDFGRAVCVERGPAVFAVLGFEKLTVAEDIFDAAGAQLIADLLQRAARFTFCGDIRGATVAAVDRPDDAVDEVFLTAHREGHAVFLDLFFAECAVHKRGTGNDQWEPVRVRCGYDEGMMLAYELLDANGQPFAAPAAAPASSTARTHCRRGHRCTTSAAARGKSTAKGKASTKATAKSAKGSGTAKTKSTTASKSTAKSTAKKTTKKSSSN